MRRMALIAWNINVSRPGLQRFTKDLVPEAGFYTDSGRLRLLRTVSQKYLYISREWHYFSSRNNYFIVRISTVNKHHFATP